MSVVKSGHMTTVDTHTNTFKEWRVTTTTTRRNVTSHDFSLLEARFGLRFQRTFVALFLGDLFGDVLHLQQQLHTLNGGDGRLGDGGRDASSGKVLHERDGVSYSQNHFGSGSTKTIAD